MTLWTAGAGAGFTAAGAFGFAAAVVVGFRFAVALVVPARLAALDGAGFAAAGRRAEPAGEAAAAGRVAPSPGG